MFYDNDSLKIYETVSSKSSNADFRLFALIDRYSSKMKDLKMIEPIFFNDDAWLINITTSKLQTTPNTFQIFIELKHSNSSKVYNGSWSVILLAIDPRNNATLHCKSLQQIMRFALMDLRLYITEVHSIMKFAVQITVNHDVQSYHSILHDLQRKYNDIAESADINIKTRDNEAIEVHKEILVLRSPVFQAMFDNNMIENSSNQIQILDFDANTIRRMVEFMYKDTFTDIESTPYEDFISLLAISNKYQITSMKEASSRYLSKKITIDNVAEMRYFAHLHNSVPLLNACVFFVRYHAHQLFNDDYFLSQCVEFGH